MSGAPGREIRHVVVLMLENRSFDCMLGGLRPAGADFDGLTGNESNVWHGNAGAERTIGVWSSADLTPGAATIPDPDPGEKFTDIAVQIAGLGGDAPMGGFVDNYMRQKAGSVPLDARAPMHFFTPGQLPVLSGLARAFAVSDRWFASAPCQTWPNRFFAHCGTAGGAVDNAPDRLPFAMPSVFNRLEEKKLAWRLYFHDFPQAATLSRLWDDVPGNFRRFADFARDAAAGTLPEYAFIEPRYFADFLLGVLPNDQHPPHDVAYGERLIAEVYAALRGGPAWRQTLLIITYDEHGGCFDHVPPPPATPPGGPYPDGFRFDRFGVRVPAVIVSPYVRPGSVLRARGATPFDHTTIIATLRALFGLGPLTARDAVAPHLLDLLEDEPANDGPADFAVPEVATPGAAAMAAERARPSNDLQASLAAAASHLPAAGVAAGVAAVGADIAARVKAFLGEV
jgi:phospholipase C